MIADLLSNPWVIFGGLTMFIIIAVVVVLSVLSDNKEQGSSDILSANNELMERRSDFRSSGHQDRDPGSASGMEKV